MEAEKMCLCPGCATWTDFLASPEQINSVLGIDAEFHNSNWPAMCRFCWKDLYQTSRSGSFEQLKQHVNTLHNAIDTNQAKYANGYTGV